MAPEILFSCRRLVGRTVTSDGAARGTAGFTLVEVLVAMVILALGLLGLEALGIGAARSIALAERQSGFAVIASDSLESAMHQLRQQQVPSQFCQDNLTFGDRLSRVVSLANPQLPTVTMRVMPSTTDLTAQSEAFEISSSLYLPVPLVGPVPGTPCS